VNDSNVDWNQSLPEVRRFASGTPPRSAVDIYGFSNLAAVVPGAPAVGLPDKPEERDRGQWW